MTRLIAYHNDPALKERVVELMQWHREQDRLIKGTYDDMQADVFRGCAVGCTLHSLEQATGIVLGSHHDHQQYEDVIGVPEVIAKLHDRIFENLPVPENQDWAERLLASIPVGADLSCVWPAVVIWLMTDPTYGVAQHLGDHRRMAERVAGLYRRELDGRAVSFKTWKSAYTDARAVAAENVNYHHVLGLAADAVACAAQTSSIVRDVDPDDDAAQIAAYVHAQSAYIAYIQACSDEVDSSAANAVYVNANRAFWCSLRDEVLKQLADAPIVS